LRASAATPRPRLAKAARRARIGARAALGKRSIYWADLKRAAPTPVYDGALLVSGNRISGPAVVETTDTTVVVHPGRSLEVDALGNFEIAFGKRAQG
jgi:N-methylhydantoinase A/oxoprolinase/acetone carboxylase beta subunit